MRSGKPFRDSAVSSLLRQGSIKDVRVTGVVMILLGAILMAGMAVLSVATMNIIMNSDDPKATTRFDGSEDQMFLMFAVFGLVFTFGLAAAAAGAWQLIFGKRNMWLIGFIFGFAIIFLLAGKAVRLFT